MNNRKAYIIKGSTIIEGARKEWIEKITISKERAEKIKKDLNKIKCISYIMQSSNSQLSSERIFINHKGKSFEFTNMFFISLLKELELLEKGLVSSVYRGLERFS